MITRASRWGQDSLAAPWSTWKAFIVPRMQVWLRYGGWIDCATLGCSKCCFQYHGDSQWCRPGPISLWEGSDEDVREENWSKPWAIRFSDQVDAMSFAG